MLQGCLGPGGGSGAACGPFPVGGAPVAINRRGRTMSASSSAMWPSGDRASGGRRRPRRRLRLLRLTARPRRLGMSIRTPSEAVEEILEEGEAV